MSTIYSVHNTRSRDIYDLVPIVFVDSFEKAEKYKNEEIVGNPVIVMEEWEENTGFAYSVFLTDTSYKNNKILSEKTFYKRSFNNKDDAINYCLEELCNYASSLIKRDIAKITNLKRIDENVFLLVALFEDGTEEELYASITQYKVQ